MPKLELSNSKFKGKHTRLIDDEKESDDIQSAPSSSPFVNIDINQPSTITTTNIDNNSISNRTSKSSNISSSGLSESINEKSISGQLSIRNDNKVNSSNSSKSPKESDRKRGKSNGEAWMAIAKSMTREEKRVTLKRLLQQSKKERKMLGIGILFTFLNSILNLCTPILMGAIISSISISNVTINDLDPPVTYICNMSPIGCNGNHNLLYTSIYTLFILTIFTSICSFTKWCALEIAGERVVARLRKTLFHRILCQEIGLFDITKTGELVNRLSTDTTVLKNACTTQVAQSLSSGTGVIISIIYVFYLSWSLSCVMLGVVPVTVIVGKYYGRYYRKQSKKNQDFLAEATEVSTESISLVRTVKSFSKEDFEEQRYCDAIDNTYTQGVKMAFANGGFMAFFTIVSNVGIGSVLWYGATLVLKGNLNTGSLTTYVILTIQIGFQFSSLLNLYTNIMKALGASERVFQLIDRIPNVNTNDNIDNKDIKSEYDPNKKNASGRDGYSGKDEIRGEVMIKNVSFGYPSRPKITVLKNLDLNVFPGKITALVGESGGGKSTVAKLVMRFYDPNEGIITIDNRPLEEYDLRWLHQQIGFVSQEPVLFAATIRDNIMYGVRQSYYDIASHIDHFQAFKRNKDKNKNKKNSGRFNHQLNQYSHLSSNESFVDINDKINNDIGIENNNNNEDINNSNTHLISNLNISGVDEKGRLIKNITENEVINAAKQANAHDFIMSFPEGYDTLVGERGIRLSGGQKQRIAIARAILMNPKILLLDEATSALDSESEYLVQQALDRIMVGRSVLVIAHRLSTVQSADRVCVIEKGKVVESGTHQELIGKENGSYSKLVKRQLFGHTHHH